MRRGAGGVSALADTSPARIRTLTQRVPTPFASLYIHVSTDETGQVCDVAISTPGKHEDTTLHETLVALGAAITECLPAKGEPG